MSSSSAPDTQVVVSLKQLVSVLERENAQLHCKVFKQPLQSLTREGRGVRRLVTLVEPIANLIAEYDHCQIQSVEQQVSPNSAVILPTTEQQHMYRAYEKLIQWCPSIHRLVGPATEADTASFDITLTCKELQKGADGARGDDAATLKTAVAQWFNESRPPPDPPFILRDKGGRGFNHEITRRLLCPVDYNWDDMDVRAAVKEYHPDFRITAHSWLSFLYADGLFKGKYLIMAFQCLFTSPSSAQNEIKSGNTARTSQSSRTTRRTHNHVARLLKMNTVQPRAIAYVATQLRFVLSSCTSWTVMDEDFNHEEFYHNIVDYFELPSSPRKAVELNELFLWWNQKIFGCQNAAHYRPQPVESLSVSLSRRA
ncbi:hypothetical protein EDC04DRAFT_2907823 [Pisolithus marmoratus]|nr:hypothetical protein EDC04DRAFT_2907823 [Pisolithus marmoratus]